MLNVTCFIMHNLRRVISLMLFLVFALSMAAHSGKDVDLKTAITKSVKALDNHRYAEAIQLLLVAKREVDNGSSRDANLAFQTYYQLGKCYSQISEHGHAMSHYYEAYRICEASKLGALNKLYVLNGIARLYFEENNMAKARGLMKRCYQAAVDMGDSTQIVAYAVNMALINNKLRRFEESRKFLSEAKRYYPRNPDSVGVTFKAVEAETCFMQRQYGKVKQIAPQIVNDKAASSDERTQAYLYLISIAQAEGRTDDALALATKAKQTASLLYLPQLFRTMTKLYQQKNNLQMALLYVDSTETARDSLARKENRTLAEESRVKFETLEIKNKVEAEFALLRHQRQISLMLAVIFLLIVAIAVVYVFSQRKRNRQEKRLMQLQLEREQQEKELAESRMKETELISRFQEQIMEKNIEHKKHELTMASMFIDSRNQLIAELLQKLHAIRDSKDNPALANIIQNLKQFIKTGESRDSFLINFESENHGLMAKLRERHPNLTTGDLNFIAYIKMNLSNSDIASLLNITQDSCKRRRIRLSKKLGLESSKSLYDYINKVSE